LDFTAVENVNIKLIPNKLKRLALNARGFIMFAHHGLLKGPFVAKNAKMIQCVIMFQEFVENAKRNLIYQEAI